MPFLDSNGPTSSFIGKQGNYCQNFMIYNPGITLDKNDPKLSEFHSGIRIRGHDKISICIIDHIT